MALLLRRPASGSSCIQFLRDALLHHPCASRSVPQRVQSYCTPVIELQYRFTISRINSPIWRPENGQWIRRVQSGQEKCEKDKPTSVNKKLILYRAKWIRPIRLLVRLKVFQFAGVVALVIPLAEYSQQGTLSLGTSAAVAAVVGGAGAASTALWYYSRRLIGEMALLLPDMRIMQISVLDFWGNREDLQYDVRDIVPPLKGMTNEELKTAAEQTVVPLDVIGDRQFFLSLRHGYLVNKDMLFSILNGSMESRDLQNTEFRT